MGLTVLEAMCGFGDGKAIVEKALGIEVTYTGFDFSNAVVARMRETRPELNIHQADVTRYETRDQYDLVVLLGGLHHVHHAAADAVKRVSARRPSRRLSVELRTDRRKSIVSLGPPKNLSTQQTV